jgi:hypothetical protein
MGIVLFTMIVRSSWCGMREGTTVISEASPVTGCDREEALLVLDARIMMAVDVSRVVNRERYIVV